MAFPAEEEIGRHHWPRNSDDPIVQDMWNQEMDDLAWSNLSHSQDEFVGASASITGGQ